MPIQPHINLASAPKCNTPTPQQRLLKRALRERSILTSGLLLGVVGTLLILIQMVLLSQAITAGFLMSASLAELRPLLGLLLGVIVVRVGVVWLAELMAHHGSAHIKMELRNQLYAHTLQLNTHTIATHTTGKLITTLSEGTEKLDAYLTRFIPQVLQIATVPVLIAGYVFFIDKLSGAILLLTGPLIMLFMWLLGSLAGKESKRQWRALKQMAAHFLDSIQGLTTLKLFNQATAQHHTIEHVSERYRHKTMQVLRLAFLSGFVLELGATLSTALVAVSIGVRLVEGYMAFAPALLILLLTPEYYLPFRQLGAHHHAGMEGVAAAQDIYALLDSPLPTDGHTPYTAASLPTITFSHVSYRYPEAPSAALHDINLTLTPNTLTALVGPSGSGKSTLLKLLLGALPPSEGIISIGDTPLSALTVASWRHQLSYVPQNPRFFQLSIADNLRLGRPASDSDLIAAATAAHAHNFITALPEGYNTVLAENGLNLSSGQRQRLALARALLPKTPLLIVDEASAYIDPETQQLLSALLTHLAQSRTVLMVTHRLAGAVEADHIVMLEHGQIIATGTHQTLQHSGLYAQLHAHAAGAL